MTTLLIATRNAHKADEIRAILGGDFDYLTLNNFPTAPAVVEDAGSFGGNATKKAVQLAQWITQMRSAKCGIRNETMLVLADDSGLEVDALHGAPGVHSARFAATNSAGNSPDEANNAKLLGLLKDVPVKNRTARFRCVLALVSVEAETSHSALRTPQLFDGTCEGRIGFSPSGQGGFGYDPLFVPEGHQQTFAELGETIKNQLSHRAKALMKLKKRLASLVSD